MKSWKPTFLMADKRFFGLYPVLPAESWFVFMVMCCRSILPDFDFGCVNGRPPRRCAANGNKSQRGCRVLLFGLSKIGAIQSEHLN
jgi:hypothetical protein